MKIEVSSEDNHNGRDKIDLFKGGKWKKHQNYSSFLTEEITNLDCMTNFQWDDTFLRLKLCN
jgi:hypothetical protein